MDPTEQAPNLVAEDGDRATVLKSIKNDIF
jgi:hypothetical protein